MGLFDFLKKKTDTNTSANQIPDLSGYRIRIYQKGSTFEEMRGLWKEYEEMYSAEINYQVNFYGYSGTPWKYMEITGKTPQEIISFWEYLNLLIWMSQKGSGLFAFAESATAQPVYATVDANNPAGDTCNALVNGKRCLCDIPAQEANWGEALNTGYDYRNVIVHTFAFPNECFDQAGATEAEWRA